MRIAALQRTLTAFALILILPGFVSERPVDPTSHATPSVEPSVIRAGFGRAVAVGNNEVFIGEPTSFRDPGTVHVFRRTAAGEWAAAESLTASDADVGDGFGQVLAVHGNTLVVGHPNAENRAGALYVFSRSAAGQPWREVSRIAASSEGASWRLGSAVVVGDGFILAGAPGYDEGDGAVFAYTLTASGVSESGVLTSPIDSEGLRLGSSLAISANRLVAGAPGYDAGNGAVALYSGGAGGWTHIATEGSPIDGARLGTQVSIDGTLVFASMPGVDEGNGGVGVFDVDGATLTLRETLRAPGQGQRLMFGASVVAAGDELWVGEPGSNEMTGRAHVYTPSGNAGCQGLAFGDDQCAPQLATLEDETLDARDAFGVSIAVNGDVAVVAAVGDAYGEGAAVVYERSNAGWTRADLVFNAPPDLDPIAGDQVDCEEGTAAGYSCQNVDLVSFVPLRDIETARGVRLNDVWGWTDPETGREYALIGTMEETVFLDLGDPANPVYLGKLPKTAGSRGNTWRDIKTYNNHAFIVADGAGQHGMQVFDLTQLRNVTDAPRTFEATALYTDIASSHNIVINERTGYAYTVGNSSGGETCGGGLHMIDIKDPLNPHFVGCFNDTRTGSGGSGATHDAQCVVYHGPDVEHQGKEICIGSNGTAISVADVSDKDNPTPISFRGYPTSAYVHQGWLTDDHRYFYQNDEGDELSGKTDRTRTLVWDLADLDDPILVTEFFGPTNATDHNLYVAGDFMYETNNASGLRIVDISDRENPVEFGHFDTTPYGKDVAGFNGTWSSYPYFESGMIVVTSRREGVFIVKKRERDL